MKLFPPTLILAFVVSFSAPSITFSQETVNPVPAAPTFRAVTEPFSGRIVFHRDDGLTYDLTVTNGLVSGSQHLSGSATPIVQVVGGWFDFAQGTLSLLLQGDLKTEAKWRVQAQQFHLDCRTRQATLEHMLYGYGLTNENSAIYTPHTLDVVDRIEHLVRTDAHATEDRLTTRSSEQASAVRPFGTSTPDLAAACR